MEESDRALLDLAARAAWMSFVGGLTQDQIAQELGISRQRAQRLVSRAWAEGLVRVRIDHPIAACQQLERDLRARFGLETAGVAPRQGGSDDPITGLAAFAAPFAERLFEAEEPQTIALGTGRTLRMVVEHMQQVAGARHKLVSLVGNVSPDGSASFYEVIMRMAEKTSAKHFPMSVPVVARSMEEAELYRSLPHVRVARALAEAADIALVGIGQMTDDAPLRADGFISANEHAELQQAGAAGEMVGHVFDDDGRFLDHPVCRRMLGVGIFEGGTPVICVGGGAKKLRAIRAALAGGLISGLITDESSARDLLGR